jgi:hypothetical protein
MQLSKLSKCATTVLLGVLLSLPQKSYANKVPILSIEPRKVKRTIKVAM